MWSRKDWINAYKEKFPNSREDILGFIFDITSHANSDEKKEAIENLFASGYCYYFALMLKDAFGGNIYWLKYRSHVVWQDSNSKICYDIHGVFTDWSEDELIPIDILGENFEIFRHRGKDTEKDVKSIQEDTRKIVENYNAAVAK